MYFVTKIWISIHEMCNYNVLWNKQIPIGAVCTWSALFALCKGMKRHTEKMKTGKPVLSNIKQIVQISMISSTVTFLKKNVACEVDYDIKLRLLALCVLKVVYTT